ncbi:MAG TPA: NUDIX hydrolase [Cyclobacteriaceae bacterium]|nr:NUDIX hydrolase [Cyclobacteriaceae bacterium]
MDRHQLEEELTQYGSFYPEELLLVTQFQTLLKHPACFNRDHLPGHITGSAWIANPYFTKVLLVHHAKLDKWLQPGGHADGNENVMNVALKELQEETGLTRAKLNRDSIFDIDIHTIPERDSFPEHLHYDVRFLFAANETDPVAINHESHDIQWVNLSKLKKYNNEKSILRMKEKLIHLNAIWN